MKKHHNTLSIIYLFYLSREKASFGWQLPVRFVLSAGINPMQSTISLPTSHLPCCGRGIFPMRFSVINCAWRGLSTQVDYLRCKPMNSYTAETLLRLTSPRSRFHYKELILFVKYVEAAGIAPAFPTSGSIRPLYLSL